MKFLNFILIVLGSFNFNLAHSMSKDLKKIGTLIWQNEASKRIDLLTFWNQHETFPSLGIGHFIWHPQNKEFTYTQQFPELCEFLKEHGVKLPEWLEKSYKIGAPWNSREDFYNDKEHLSELQNLLASTIDIQTQFIINQFNKKLKLILKVCPEHKKEKIINLLKLLLSSSIGTYALIDYSNFKGDGLNPKENKNGIQWGLLQVLSGIDVESNSNNVNKVFAISAAKTLLKLIENSGPEYNNIRYLHGWMRRISSYADSNIFNKLD